MIRFVRHNSNIFRKFLWWLGAALLACALLPTLALADVIPCDPDPVGLLRDGDRLHLLYHKQCYMVTEEHPLAPCPLHCESGGIMHCTMVTPQGHTCAVNVDGFLYRWTPDGPTPWEPITKLNLSAGCPLESDIYLAGENVIYEAALDSDAAVWTLIAHQVIPGADEAQRTVLLRESGFHYTDITPHVLPDNSLALITGSTYSTVSIKKVEDGSRTTTLVKPDRVGFSGAITDGQDGWIVLGDCELLHLDREGKSTVINYVPHFSAPRMIALVPCFDNEIAYMTEDNGEYKLVIMPLAPQEQPVLRVGGDSSVLNLNDKAKAVLAFEAAHPGTIIAQLSYPVRFEEIAEVLARRENFCDIYILREADGGISNMLRKGYYTDLSDCAPISDFVAELYPVWRDEVTVNGQIAALPLASLGDYGIAYNKTLWEELALGDVPTTWDQLLDCIERLYHSGVLEEHRLFSRGKRSAMQLLEQLVKSNAALYERDGLPAQYNNARLLPLLERLAQLAPLLDDHDAHLPEAEGLFVTGAAIKPGIYGYNSYITTNQFDPLYLSFDTSGDYAVLADMYVAVIDPQCTQKELAMEFLTILLDEMSTHERVSFINKQFPAIEYHEYASNLASLQESLVYDQAQLDAARASKEPADVIQYWKDDIETVKQWIAELNEEGRWMITEDQAAAYHDVAHRYVLYRANGPELIYKNAGASFSNFLDGKIDAAAFVRRLDQVMTMWTLENQ